MEANRTRTQVHRLPTEESHIVKDIGHGDLKLIYFSDIKSTKGWYECQHLYFTTDEEIKEGDWVVQQFEKQDADVCQITNGEYEIAPDIQRKIIASTDPELVFIEDYGYAKAGFPLPQPSQAFVKAYCEQGGIDEVDVEYELIWEETGWNKMVGKILKVDPIHNTITTHRIVEKMYSRENLENLMMQSYIYGQSDKTDSFHKRESTIEKLIKENL